MTQLYVLSQDGTSAINLSQFEYVYIGEDNRIKAVNGQKMIRLGDYASRDGAKVALGSMLYYASRNPGAGWYKMMRSSDAENHVIRDRDIHSLRWEIFKNPESIALIQAAQRAATKK